MLIFLIIIHELYISLTNEFKFSKGYVPIENLEYIRIYEQLNHQFHETIEFGTSISLLLKL